MRLLAVSFIVIWFICRQKLVNVFKTPTPWPSNIYFMFFHFKRRFYHFTYSYSSTPRIKIIWYPSTWILLNVVTNRKLTLFVHFYLIQLTCERSRAHLQSFQSAQYQLRVGFRELLGGIVQTKRWQSASGAINTMAGEAKKTTDGKIM